MNNRVTIELPEKVKWILHTMTTAGYEAYAVGGCIRDSILGKEPNDWDITTSATPLQIKELFRRTVDTGIKHGTVTVLVEDQGFEVTTYRIDGEYEDGRHPREVTFTSNLKEDLRRRDFTINAMAYNEQAGLVDIFGGIQDIENGVIRCVGSPAERFTEDALRIMRAVRFSAQLGYEIEEETRKAIIQQADSLKKISAERIQTELLKLLLSDHPDEIRNAYQFGITKVILPEFDRCMETEQHNPHHCYTVGEHIIHSVMAVRSHKMLRLAMLFHDMGKPDCLSTDSSGIDHFHGHPAVSEEIASTVLHRLKFDNETINTVKRLVRFHDRNIEPEPREVRRAVAKIGEDLFPLLLEVKRADIMAQSDFLRVEKQNRIRKLSALYEELLEKKQCVSLKKLAVTGSDLIAEAGYKPGKKLGEVLQKLLEIVVDDPERNTKEQLIKIAEELRDM